MPMRKDEASGRRWVEMELLLPGTPEEVWQVMATGPGTSAWFTQTEIEERVGGRVRFDFGSIGESVGTVTVWEPPHRFAYEESDWNPGAPPVATEITIASRGGGECVVRMVHSLFTSSEEWDDQLEGFEGGWPGFFDVLRLYLGHFRGRKAIPFSVRGGGEADEHGSWKKLTQAVGLAGADVGDRRTLAAPEALSGVVERIDQRDGPRHLVMRIEDPIPAIVLLGTYTVGDGVDCVIAFYDYGENAHATAERQRRWEDWFSRSFPARPLQRIG